MKFLRLFLSVIALLLTNLFVRAQEAAAGAAPKASDTGSSLELTPQFLVGTIAIILLFVILGMVRTLKVAMQLYADKHINSKPSSSSKVASIAMLLLFTSLASSAQEAKTQVSFDNSPTVFLIFSLVVIAIEVIAIFYLLRTIRFYMGLDTSFERSTVQKENQWSLQNIWNKMNKFKPLDQEANMDTGHNYDGIRELDNITPPWFTVSFLATILFAIIYLWRYHVAESAPLMIEEYKIAMEEGEREKAEYLKIAGNKVDENSVKLLTGNDLDEGKKVFATNCVACHGDKGQGGVGPNFTDEYWLHGGGIKDIFKTVKYGVVEKGMKSWKDDLSPMQIAQVTSYIKTLKGTNPPGGKEPQGTIYKEDAAPATSSTSDSSSKSTVVVTDSTKK